MSISDLSPNFSREQARTDTIGLLMAILIEKTTGDLEPRRNSIQHIIQNPMRAAACIMTLSNLLAQYAAPTGPGLRGLVDYLMGVAEKGAVLHDGDERRIH